MSGLLAVFSILLCFCVVDDWNAALLQPSSANMQKPLESPVIRIYMSAPKEMENEIKIFKEVKNKKH